MYIFRGFFPSDFSPIMQDFILTLLLNIHGIGAASGLLYDNGKLLLISDNSNCLYTYNIETSKFGKKAIEPSGISENIPKAIKPDYEALAIADGKLYLFGSGSTPKRNGMASISYPDMRKTSIFDLSKLYESMRAVSQLSTNDFNLEGAAKLNGKWYFFQRGNGPAKNNGVFTVDGNITGSDFSIEYRAITLPDCNGIPATFTDAVAVDGKIYFIGTAENSNSVYHDGEILGSIIGCIDPESMQIVFTRQISQKNKFEGLAFVEKSGTDIVFMLCEDTDSEASDSAIYKLKLTVGQ